MVVILRLAKQDSRSVLFAGAISSFALVFCGVSTSCTPAPTSPIVAPSTTLEVPRIADGGAGAEPAVTKNGVRFGRVPPAVGVKWAVTVDARSEASHPDPSAPGGASVQLSEYVSEYTVEILEVNGPAPSKVRLAFEKNVQSYQGNDKATSIDGKTYVVQAIEPHVLDTSGTGALEEEAQRVLDVFPDLGTRTQIDQVLPDIAMQFGEERHELAGAVLHVIHPRAWTLTRGTAVLSRVDEADPKNGPVGVFAITIDARGQSGIRMDVKGEARIRLRDARLVGIALDGTYDHPKGALATEPGKFALRRTVRDL